MTSGRGFSLCLWTLLDDGLSEEAMPCLHILHLFQGFTWPLPQKDIYCSMSNVSLYLGGLPACVVKAAYLYIPIIIA